MGVVYQPTVAGRLSPMSTPTAVFPWLTYAAIAAMVAVIAAMALVDDVRSQLIPSFISLAVVLVAGWLRYRRTGARASVRGTQPSRT